MMIENGWTKELERLRAENTELREMRVLSLFSGIGGLDLAAEWAGMETVAFCEIEPYAVEILKRRWPDVPVYSDVRELDREQLEADGILPIDVVTGGFPCQDLSVAGKQAGLEGARSGLWFEMLRVIAECRPSFVLAENVRGAVNLALDTVYANLVGEGYEVRPYVIPASAVGAPHQRERLFVVGVREDVADCASERLQRSLAEEGSECGGKNGRELAVEGGCAGKLWPTPHRNCSNGAGAHGDGGLNIQTAVSLWRTPDANCMRGPSSEERMKWKRGKGMPISINDQVGKGSLNPAWVEILMGFPIGWTDVGCDEPKPWPGWPALMGEEQYPYEPPRTVTGCPNRAKRLECLGNAVVPQQAYPFFEGIAQIHNLTTPNVPRETLRKGME